MTYAEKLKHPRWQKKRLEILKRDKWTCRTCGDTETTLNIHHKKYTVNNVWDELNENLITLCKHCHEEIESLKNECAEFEKISIHKSNDWQRGGRIMFASYDNILSMRIYNKNDEYISGFSFCNDLPALKKLINKSLRSSG